MLQACEKFLANLLVASRWLMAPLYLGLLAVLVVVVVAFFHDLVETVRGLADLHRDGVILGTLHLIDLVLVGNLVLIVIGAGIDTVVSRRVADGLRSRPTWMAKEDFAGLKLKVVASIIAIAAVDLLESYIEIDTVDTGRMAWKLAVFLAFVVAGVLLAWMDRLAADTH
ncbi:MAG TPA: YqhA family protein [Stellaceae bacterium]|jgi:uncharacterized protein (TIGR00645 family)|nr:YqhA family protein [Stellaceae bacterium]